MAENAARVAWAGAGVSLPRRLVTARGVRLAVRRVLGEPSYAQRARELRDWSALNDGAANAADLVERLASGRPEALVKQPVVGLGSERDDRSPTAPHRRRSRSLARAGRAAARRAPRSCPSRASPASKLGAQESDVRAGLGEPSSSRERRGRRPAACSSTDGRSSRCMLRRRARRRRHDPVAQREDVERRRDRDVAGDARAQAARRALRASCAPYTICSVAKRGDHDGLRTCGAARSTRSR